MKFVIIFVVLHFLAISEAANVVCQYQTEGWNVISDVYRCRVENSLEITSRDNAVIDSFSPAPERDVKGFRVVDKTIHYFPRNLDKLFPELEGMIIFNCGMKEVTQSDLKPFPKLRHINLSLNDIEVLNDGLFDFNPDMEFIRFWRCKIHQIGSNVFNHLQKLEWLDLGSNYCINIEKTNRAFVQYLITFDIKKHCSATPETTTDGNSNDDNSDD